MWIPALALAVAAAASPSAPSPYPSVAETRAEFETVCRELTAGDNPYFGRAILSRLRHRLELVRASATPVPVETAIGIRGMLAEELLRVGDNEEAVRLLEEAFGIASENRADRGVLGTLLYHLGIASMRLAEEINCVQMHGPASCILPIDSSAIHSKPEAIRKAGDYFLAALEQNPEEIQARWLLNLARALSNDPLAKVPERFRMPADAFVSPGAATRWKNRGPDLGLDRSDLAGGAIMDDFDGDGLLDLVTSSWDPCTSMKAYRNEGNGSFSDVTSAWGLDGQLGGLN
ncbi:MAG TPA: FG-GAP-like repeat-containing protein, partial [Thermoanaerobaculia bacterium]|nr:FG-GAP-like repeat-containing protein [Thermoanaerobaculia bacterium]